MTGVKGNGPPWGVKGQGGAYGIPGVYAALDRTGPLTELMKRDGAWGIWKLDEASGSTVFDYSGNARDMAITGAPAAYRASIGGKTQYGMAWPATSTDKAQTAVNPPTPANYTMEALVYLTAIPSVNAGIMECSSLTTGSGLFIFGGTTTPRHQCTNSGGTFQSGTALSLNTLYHIACMNSGGTMRMWVNGVSPVNGAKTALNNGPVKIHGGLNASGGAVTVAMAAYYDNIALTDAQINEHYAQM